MHPGYFVLPLIGPDGCGKSTLARALSEAARAPMREVRVDGRAATVLDVQGPSQVYQFVDFANDQNERALLGSSGARGAILVVSALDSVMPGTRASLEAARASGIPIVAAAITKCDCVEDMDLVELLTMEVCDLLEKRDARLDAARVIMTGARTERPREDGPENGPRRLLAAVIR